MEEAFIDCKCRDCNGTGNNLNTNDICNKCNGTGSIGEYKKVPDIYISENGGIKELRITRFNRKVGIRDLSLILNITPSRLSDLETGIGGAFPTQEKLNKISSWIQNNTN